MYLETTTARTEPDATYLPCVGSNTSLQYLLCWHAWAEWHNRCVSTRKGLGQRGCVSGCFTWL